MRTLFDDNKETEKSKSVKKEVLPLDKFKNLEDKISVAIERVKTLKEEKIITDRRIKELEQLLDEKNQEIEKLKAEKNLVKSQLETLLGEIESIEAD